MTPLFETIKQHILTHGPISLAQYMRMCLTDPDHGYYTSQRPDKTATNQSPFGASGDFTTAPEISQLFGEMIGIYVAQKWIEFGQTSDFQLVEAGPGRGTLMADLLRATKHIPGFHAAMDIIMVEISPPLRDIQRAALSAYQDHIDIQWVDAIDQISATEKSASPLFFIGNEFLDALPIDQYYISPEQIWYERSIDYDAAKNELHYSLTPADDINNRIAPQYISWAQDAFKQHYAAQKNDVPNMFFEYSPAQYDAAQKLAAHLTKRPGFALFIDYGYADMALGDTFQAIEKHQFTPPLASPGAADLTSHVNFTMLSDIAQQNGLRAIKTDNQGHFLNALGIRERAANLAQQNPQHKEKLLQDLHRLTHHSEMGSLFKIGGFMNPPTPYITHKEFDNFIAQHLDNQTAIKHAFFTRQGGVSPAPYTSLNCAFGSKDMRSNVLENITRVKQSMGVEKLVQLKQIHSPDCITITSHDHAQHMIDDRSEGDALVTNIPGIAIGALAADCTPILFAAPAPISGESPIIGAAHAGWGGAFGGVVEGTIAAMEKLGATIDDIAVAIGPCIAQDSYEVGGEFYDRFITQDTKNAQFFIKKDATSTNWYFDLPGYISARLKTAGIKYIHHIAQDTYANEDLFFSYRRATHRKESDYGRQISCIAITHHG